MQISKLIGLKREARQSGWRFDWTPADEDALLKGCFYDEAAGNAPVDFIQSFCCHSKGKWAGQKIELMQWQVERVFLPLFGWMRADGTRRYREMYLTVAKKNGKSTICAGVMIYLLVGDGESGAEIYTVATTKQQTDNVYNPCAAMVSQSPELRKILSVTPSTKTITYGESAWIRALSSDAPGAEGQNAHCCIIDELHVHKSSKLYDALKGSGAARAQPLFINITTRGEDEDSLCGTVDNQALRILAGEEFNYEFLPIVFAPDSDADVDDIATWDAANPCMGEVIDRASFGLALDSARKRGPSAWSQFKRYRLNMWSGSENPELDVEKWKLCKLEEAPLPDELRDAVCWGGLDMASKEDICCWALCFQLPEYCYFVTRHYVPQSKIDSEVEAGRSNYFQWAKAGEMIVSSGAIISQAEVEEQIRADFEQYQLKGIRFDPWNTSEIVRKLMNSGIECVEMQPGSKKLWSEPTKAFKNAIMDLELRHDGNSCMSWQIGNVVFQEDPQENVVPIKKGKKRRYKIDGPCAAIMAYAGVTYAEAQPEGYKVGDEFTVF